MESIDWHRQGYIPVLLYFQNGNAQSGDVGNFRYMLTPKDGKIVVEVWRGPFCREKSEIVDQSEHSLDAEGRSAAIDWLKEKYESF